MSAAKQRGTLTPRAQANLVYTILMGAGLDNATASTAANAVRHMPIDCRGRNRENLLQAINDEIAACRGRGARSARQPNLKLVVGSGSTNG